MAIYHATTKPISRSNGHSATAKSSYITGQKMINERTGEIFDYTKKSGVIEHEIILPIGINLSLKSDELWNKAEQSENRKDARVGREWEISLPHELTIEQRKNLAQEITKIIADKYQVACEYALHNPSKQGNQKNYHVHILTTTRQINKDGNLTEKSNIELSNTKLDKLKLPRSDEQIKTIREIIANKINKYLEYANIQEKVDHRSLKGQGLDKIPTIHKGKAVIEMERRGIETKVNEINKEIKEANKMINILIEKVTYDGYELTKTNAELEILQRTIEQEKQKQEEIRKEQELSKQNNITGIYRNPLFNVAREHGEFFTRKFENNASYYESRDGGVRVYTELVSVQKESQINIELALDVAVAKFGNGILIQGNLKFVNNAIETLANNPKYTNIKLSNFEQQKQLEQARIQQYEKSKILQPQTATEKVKEYLKQQEQEIKQVPEIIEKLQPKHELSATERAKQLLANQKVKPLQEIKQELEQKKQQQTQEKNHDYNHNIDNSYNFER